MPSQDLTSQVVVITGASSGIGRASALAFAEAGAIPVLIGRSVERLEQATRDVQSLQPDASWYAMDITDRTLVKATVAAILERYGRIDVLFNNAGHARVGPIEDASFVEDARSMFEVDFLGTVNVSQAFLPSMRARESGHILNMSSVVGRKAFPNFGAYSSIMFAISGFTDALRQELAGTGVHVSIIHPALTQTPLLADVDQDAMPMPFRKMSPISAEDVASAAVRAIRRGDRRIIVPNQPRALLFMAALSPVLGDWIVRMLSNPTFGRLIGSYRGYVYEHAAVTTST